MVKALDISGQRFGMLTAISPTTDRRDGKVLWRFRCDCGREVKVSAKDAKSGNSRSCGCRRATTIREISGAMRTQKKCPQCLRAFSVKKSRAIKSTYCSKKCMALAYTTRLTGSANPNFRGRSDADRLEWQRQWRQANPDKIGIANKRTRARRRGVIGDFTGDDIENLRRRQDDRCAACHCGLEGGGHVDHIIPISRGGTNFVGNLQMLCSQCNLRKKVMLPIEYRARVLKGASEDAEQCEVIAWASENIDRLPGLVALFHIANGGYRDKRTANRLRALGVKKGVPDLFLATARGEYGGLFIEMKVGRNKATPEQRAWISALNQLGYLALVCTGADETIATIERYLALPTRVVVGLTSS